MNGRRVSVPRLVRLVAVLLTGLVVALAVGAGAPASAHADLVSTDPAEGAVLDAAPEQMAFTFTEAVAGVSDGVQVFDAVGGVVPSSSAVKGKVLTVGLDQEVGDGTYVVVWRVISEDGHPVSGSLSFSIGAASETVQVPPAAATPTDDVPWTLTVARWLGYVGLLLCVGLVWFVAAVLPAADDDTRARRRLVRVLRVAAPLTAAAWLAGLPLTALYQSGGGADSLLESAAWSTMASTEYVVAACVALGVLLATLMVGAAGPGRTRGRVALAAAVVAACAPALTGHTRAASPEVLVVGVDMLHLLAASVWLGGLVALVLVLPVLAGRGPVAADVLARFSTVAAGVLAVLVVSGTVLAWRIMGSLTALFDTGYGRLLAIKIGVALLVVAIAGWNRYAVLPRVRAATPSGDLGSGTRLVVRAAAAEAALLVVLLLVTGMLVDRNPEAGRGADSAGAAEPGVQTGMLGAHEVEVTLDPLATGANTVSVSTRDAAGEPFEGFDAPKIRVESDDIDLGEIALESIAPGEYAGDVVLPAPGTWRVQVSLRVSEFDNPVQTFAFSVGDE